jgi:hypothetical protein
MRQALTMDVLATDLADYLVRKGVSVIFVRMCLPQTGMMRRTGSIQRNASRIWSRSSPRGVPEVSTERAHSRRLQESSC